jgi:hypothetical protein
VIWASVSRGVPSAPKATGGGVADEGEFRGFERAETEADQQRAGDRHGRAEARRTLDERTEAEGNQQCLHAAVARQAGDLLLHDGELAGVHRKLIDKDRVEDDPADGKQAIRRAVARRREREGRRHPVDEDRQRNGGEQAGERGNLGAHVEKREEAEEDDDGQRGDQG